MLSKEVREAAASASFRASMIYGGMYPQITEAEDGIIGEYDTWFMSALEDRATRNALEEAYVKLPAIENEAMRSLEECARGILALLIAT